MGGGKRNPFKDVSRLGVPGLGCPWKIRVFGDEFNLGRLKELSSWGFENSLAMELYSNELCHPLLILNVYGPCLEREQFWNFLFSKSCLKNPNLIVGGDLNFSLGSLESRGPLAREN